LKAKNRDFGFKTTSLSCDTLDAPSPERPVSISSRGGIRMRKV